MKAPEKGSGSFSDDNDAASRQFPAVRRRAPAHAEIPENNIVLIARQPRIDLPGIAQHIVQRSVESPALRYRTHGRCRFLFGARRASEDRAAQKTSAPATEEGVLTPLLFEKCTLTPVFASN